MRNALILAYGAGCYVLFLITFVYLVGFIVDAPLPITIDRPPPVSGSIARDWVVDLALLGLFAAQHSVMARRGFKRWLGRRIDPALERSTYVLATGLVLIAWFLWWRPLPGVVWDVGPTWARWSLYAIAGCGWLTVLVGTWMVDHFDLAGLRQTWLRARGRAYTPPGFVDRWFYRMVRHPLMLGFIVAFWAAPTLTVGHLLFALAMTVYILLAVRLLEERDLVARHGDAYRAYRRRVPMLCPWPRPKQGPARRGAAPEPQPSTSAGARGAAVGSTRP